MQQRPPEPAADLAGIVAEWSVGAILEARQPDTGTINQTVLLTADRGRFVLRGYHHSELEPITREHAVIAHVCGQGLPAVPPVPLPGGGAILTRGGRYYSLFRWARGHQVRRADIGPREAAAMGACLARLHLALSTFPQERVPIPRRSFSLSRDATLRAIATLEEVVAAGLPADPLAPTVLARLAQQRAHVARLAAYGPAPDGALPEQVIHGDFQDANLFFEGAEVSAVIDWDQTYVASRAWEVMRTFDLVFDFEPERCQHFIAAYREVQPLTPVELDTAAALYDVKAAHHLWVYEELYVRGNRRVGRFIEGSGPYVPPSERWARVRSARAL